MDTTNKVAVEMIAATLAHEVKNPLSSIKLNVDYLQMCDTDETHAKNYDIIKRELDKTNEIIIGFIDSMEIMYQGHEPFSLTTLIDDVIDSFQKSYNSDIKFIVNNSNENIDINTNKQLLITLINNVVKNSADAVNYKGTVEIKINKLCTNVVLTFLDDGPGIPNEVLEKIYNNEPVTTKKLGTGIGVKICKRIADELKATYTIENVTGGGCLVTLSLPNT